jgi:hypothetical protein
VGRERPTGGLADAPSSKAVEEAGHFERIVRFGMDDGKKRKPLKHGGKEEAEEVRLCVLESSSISNIRSILDFLGNFGVTGNFRFLCFLRSSVFQKILFYSASATNSPVSIFPALFICTKIR